MADLDVVVLYPELLDLYGDAGNAAAIRHRAALHGLRVRVIEVGAREPVPASGDLYIVGGAEDAAMTAAVDLLRRSAGLDRAISLGASVLGVCAGFQILGRRLEGPDGRPLRGLGHLDVESHLRPQRAVGDIVTESRYVGEMQGFENHRGETRLGRQARRLGTVRVGIGNGHQHSEGAVQGNVVGTYLHGPVLVRNPALSDLLLTRMTGLSLRPVEDPLVERLRAERREQLRPRRRRLLRWRTR